MLWKIIRVKQRVIKETAFTVFGFTVLEQLSLVPVIFQLTYTALLQMKKSQSMTLNFRVVIDPKIL